MVIMVGAMVILGLASILASGILFSHMRMLTLLAAAGALFEGGWLLLTLVHRVVWPARQEAVFLAGSLLFLGLLWLGRRQWRWPYRAAGSGWRDVVVIAVLVPVLASAWLIGRANGFVGADWVAHGFYNGDTATFIALLQRSLVSDGLVSANPFAGNGPLEYPTLVHAGLAEIVGIFGTRHDWLFFVPLIVFIQIVITVPLFFLLRDAVSGQHRWPTLLLEGVTAGYIMALSLESYVYLQGHFFTTALFILLVATLVRVWPRQGRQQVLGLAIAGCLTMLLVLSNAVTGAAAAVVWSVFALLRSSEAARPAQERSAYAVSIAFLAIFYLTFTSTQGTLSLTPWFSYTAAGNIMMMGAPLLLLLLAQFGQIRQQSFITATTTALAGIGLMVFVFSDLNIIIDNASRFLYHALLVGWPLAVDRIIHGTRVLRARVKRLNRLPLQASAVLSGAVMAALLAWPAAASVASVYDHLLFKEEHITGASVRNAMQWIVAETPPGSVWLASPEAPWEIPLFTGRALLRANYWLSPDDELAWQVTAAFGGDKFMQQQLLSQVDYVALKAEERHDWDLLSEKILYDLGGVVIYEAGPVEN